MASQLLPTFSTTKPFYKLQYFFLQEPLLERLNSPKNNKYFILSDKKKISRYFYKIVILQTDKGKKR